VQRYFDHLESDIPAAEKMHLAMYLRFLQSDWSTKHKMELFRFLAKTKTWEGGGGYPVYLGKVARDVAKTLTLEESIQVLPQGDELPDAGLGALYNLPPQLNDDLRRALQELDERITHHSDSASKQLMVGIVAVLARDGDDQSMAYLRSVWDRNPERREPVAMGLAQSPHGENWKYLVRSLPLVESETLGEVVCRLLSVDRAPDDPEHVRQLILAGLRLKKQWAEETVMLLENWTGESVGTDTDDWQRKIELWRDWFARSYPDMPPATLPRGTVETKWKFDELYEFLRGQGGGGGDTADGAAVFQEATCGKCHRYGKVGESMGPDLTDLTKRRTRKEILQSVLYPSHVIASQYASKKVVLADSRVLSGIVAPGAAGEKVLLDSDGEKTSIPEEEIDDIVPSNVSGMPDGLLEELSQEEIADLFSYLSSESVVGLAKRPKDEQEEEPAMEK
ncbi:MAG: heme-binding protein, partial [Planctomycetota bacterium]